MDLTVQISQLNQSIQETKRPMGLFLGAGCGLAVKSDEGTALVPDTRGLTEAVGKRMREDELEEAWESILDQLDDGERAPNVEDVLSQIRGLYQFAGNDVVRGLEASALRALDSKVSQEIVEIVNQSLPDQRTPYHDLARWLTIVNRDYPTEIFTTNYDLLIEQALEEYRCAYFDGFVGSRRPFFDPASISSDDLPRRWARLWKLHGSINWADSRFQRNTG